MPRTTAWTSGLCSQIDPDVLLQAAQPLPAPDGVGPVRFVVGGNLGENRLMALDRKGRTLAYGTGDGDARDVDVCPVRPAPSKRSRGGAGRSWW